MIRYVVIRYVVIRYVWIVAMVGLQCAVASADDSGWRKFNAEEGRFSATFPAPPTETRKKLANPDVVADVRYEAKRDDVTYLAGFIAYSKETAEGLDAVDPAEFATFHRESTVKNTQGEVLSQQDVTIGDAKRPGYELLIRISPRVFMRQRVCYAQGKLYQLMVVGASQAAVTGMNAHMFLDSFQIVD